MGEKMSDESRRFYLRIALIVVGLIAIFGLYPLLILWPSGWSWGHGHSHYVMMIVGIYATLGVFLLIASQNPEANRSLIWFTIWSSLVHGGIMAIQAIGDSEERGHLLGDVPALFLIAIALAGLMPRTARAQA
jgi:FtsH-binding integral membrane protein